MYIPAESWLVGIFVLLKDVNAKFSRILPLASRISPLIFSGNGLLIDIDSDPGFGKMENEAENCCSFTPMKEQSCPNWLAYVVVKNVR